MIGVCSKLRCTIYPSWQLEQNEIIPGEDLEPNLAQSSINQHKRTKEAPQTISLIPTGFPF